MTRHDADFFVDHGINHIANCALNAGNGRLIGEELSVNGGYETEQLKGKYSNEILWDVVVALF